MRTLKRLMMVVPLVLLVFTMGCKDEMEVNYTADDFVCTKFQQYDGDDSMTEEYIYEYDSQKNNTKIIYNKYGGPTVNSTTYLMTYNSENQLLETEITMVNSLGTTIENRTYEYDEAGNQTKKSIFNDSDQLKGYNAYQYDSNGNMLLWSIYDKDNILVNQTTYEYDSSGNLITEEITADDVVETRFEYEYDEQDNQIMKRIITSEYTSEYEYEYDANHNIIKSSIVPSETTSMYSYTEYYYNTDNLLTEEVTYLVDLSSGVEEITEQLSTINTYDSYGHFIRKEVYMLGKLYSYAVYEWEVA